MSQLNLTLNEVRTLLGGGQLVGSGEFLCDGVASLESAGPSDLSFVKGDRHFDAARASGAGALLVPAAIDGVKAHQLAVPDPFQAFGAVLHVVARKKRHHSPGVHAGAHVHESATIGERVTIGPGAVVSEGAAVGDGSIIYAGAYLGRRSTVGSDCVLHPNVVVLEDVQIGDRVTIHGGAVVGADGYGFVQHQGRHIKVPQVGGVVIGDDVEIGALTTIDRATMDETVIGRGTKIGDMVHVAHNCRIGEDVLLLPTVAISGSVVVGDRVVFAGRAGCSDNVEIGEGAVLAATAVAYRDVPAGARVWGNPAREHGEEKRSQVLIRRLPRMAADIRDIKKALGL